MKIFLLPFLFALVSVAVAQKPSATKAIEINFDATFFATDGEEFFFFSKTDEKTVESIEFRGLFKSNTVKDNEIRISETMVLAAPRFTITKSKFEGLDPRSINELKPMSDEVFLKKIQSGTFVKSSDKRLFTFDVPGGFAGLSCEYFPFRPRSYLVGSDTSLAARIDSMLAPRILQKNGQKWEPNEARWLSLVLFRLNEEIPMAMFFEEDAQPSGCILPTQSGLELILEGDENWIFEKNDAPKYRDWAHEFLPPTQTKYTVFRKNQLAGLLDSTTGIEVLLPAFQDIKFSWAYVFAQRDTENLCLFDAFLRPLLCPKKGDKRQLRAADARLQHKIGIQILVENELLWRTPTGKLVRKPSIYDPPGGFCGTINHWDDSIALEIDRWHEIIFSKSTPIGSTHSDSYQLGWHTGWGYYTDFCFLNGKKRQRYDGNTRLLTVYDIVPFSTCIATRADGKFDLLELKNVDREELEVNVLIKDADFVAQTGNLEPLFFKKNGLWGVFPAMTEGRFSKIEPFDYFFAKVELPNGSKGWVDLQGQVYLFEK